MEYSESQADSQSQSNLVQGTLLSMSTELDKQGTAITGLNTTISGLKTTMLELQAENVILKTDNMILKTDNVILKTDNGILKGKITTIEEQMEVIISEKIADRNRMLVRQIIFAYQMHLSRAYKVCKEGSKLKHLSSMTHKIIFSKISDDEKKNFEKTITEKFATASNDILGTVADVDTCLAEIRSLGTDSSHPYLMFEKGTMKAVPPKESDMLKMIDELEDVSEDLKVGARVALNVLLELADGELHFLKIT